MKFCYVDESGVAGTDDWFFLGGFILDVADTAFSDTTDRAVHGTGCSQIGSCPEKSLKEAMIGAFSAISDR